MTIATKQQVQDSFNDWVVKSVTKFNTIAGKTKAELIGSQQEDLCREELKELLAALAEGDTLTAAKEACDCVIVGAPYWPDIDGIPYSCLEALVRNIETSLLDNYFEGTGSIGNSTLDLLAVDSHAIMKRTLTSNLSKFSRYQHHLEDAYDTHNTYLMKDGRYTDVTWQLSTYEGKQFVVWKDGSGKVLKGWNYRPPYIGDCLLEVL